MSGFQPLIYYLYKYRKRTTHISLAKMGFYVTLPSDSSMKYFIDNKISHFITRLPKPIELKGEWEVGLSEFFYPHTWYNVMFGNNAFSYDLGDGIVYDGEIREGFYHSVKDILHAIMSVSAFEGRIKLSFNPVSKLVRVELREGAKILFKDGLARMLGFHPTWVEDQFPNIRLSPFIADPCADYRVLMLYTDIIEPQVVGDVFAPLLRIVNVTGNDGDMVLEQYDRPHYLPVNRKIIETLEIVIRMHNGNLTPFERGRSYVKLHFRQKYLP